MPWKDVGFEARDYALAAYENRNTQEILSLAKQYGMKPTALTRRCREHRLYRRQYAAKILRPSELSKDTYTNYESVSIERAIVTSDWEEPYADELMKRLVMLMAIRFDVHDLIVNGDFIAADQPGISSHTPMFAEDDMLSLRSVFDHATVDFEMAMQWFKRFWFTTGNHDNMVNRVTGGQVTLGMMMQGRLEGARFSDYAYMVAETDCGPYLICHPQQYSNISLALGQKIYNTWATRDGRKAHIVLGHTHHSQEGDSPDGLRGIYGLGCIRHPDKAAYKNLNVSTFHQWSQGFGMLLDGKFHNLSLKRTDWRFYLGDLCPEELWTRTYFPSAVVSVPALTS